MESEYKDGLLSIRQLLVALGVTGTAAATTGFLGIVHCADDHGCEERVRAPRQ